MPIKYHTYTIGTNNQFLESGHTMFPQDVVRCLNRKSYLEAENARLKAREANYLEGLRRLGRMMTQGEVVYHSILGKWFAYGSGNEIATGEDLSILIDNLLTQEQEDDTDSVRGVPV